MTGPSSDGPPRIRRPAVPPGAEEPRRAASDPSRDAAARRTRTRYDRVAQFYDACESLMEGLAYRRWRRIAWKHVEGRRILEIGIGTGRNLPYHSGNREMTVVDLSGRMLRHAVRRSRGRTDLRFSQMDAQALGFPDDTFDTVIGTFVFCSVPDPELGLTEAFRVLRPGGRLVLLEHVLSTLPLLRPVMRLMNPLFVSLTGANIDRETVERVRRSPFELEEVWDLGVSRVYKLIVARKPAGARSVEGRSTGEATPGSRPCGQCSWGGVPSAWL